MSISKIKEKSLTTGAVTDANFDNTVLTDQTELSATAADDDILLVYDTSAGTLKKVSAGNVGTQSVTLTSKWLLYEAFMTKKYWKIIKIITFWDNAAKLCITCTRLVFFSQICTESFKLWIIFPKF